MIYVDILVRIWYIIDHICRHSGRDLVNKWFGDISRHPGTEVVEDLVI